MIPILLIILLITVNVNADKDWVQHVMQLKKWKSDDGVPPPLCVNELIELNNLKPDGWESFTRVEQTAVLDCMLLHTKLVSPSKINTDMELKCDLLLKSYSAMMWNLIVYSKLEKTFVECVIERALDYELEDTFESSEINIGGGMKGVQWIRKQDKKKEDNTM